MEKSYIVVTGFIVGTAYDRINGDLIKSNLLEDKVSEMISKGYIPSGSMITRDGHTAYQPMILKDLI